VVLLRQYFKDLIDRFTPGAHELVEKVEQASIHSERT
jgi:hypothetical protein